MPRTGLGSPRRHSPAPRSAAPGPAARRRRRPVYTENTAPSSKIFAAPTIGKKPSPSGRGWPPFFFFYCFLSLLLIFYIFPKSQSDVSLAESAVSSPASSAGKHGRGARSRSPLHRGTRGGDSGGRPRGPAALGRCSAPPWSRGSRRDGGRGREMPRPGSERRVPLGCRGQLRVCFSAVPRVPLPGSARGRSSASRLFPSAVSCPQRGQGAGGVPLSQPQPRSLPAELPLSAMP